jgi:hypothetical protein
MYQTQVDGNVAQDDESKSKRNKIIAIVLLILFILSLIFNIAMGAVLIIKNLQPNGPIILSGNVKLSAEAKTPDGIKVDSFVLKDSVIVPGHTTPYVVSLKNVDKYNYCFFRVSIKFVMQKNKKGDYEPSDFVKLEIDGEDYVANAEDGKIYYKYVLTNHQGSDSLDMPIKFVVNKDLTSADVEKIDFDSYNYKLQIQIESECSENVNVNADFGGWQYIKKVQ